MNLLTINNLKTYFYSNGKPIKAVDGVSLWVNEGEVLGLVGESGCGKSVTALSIMRLIPSPPGRIIEGEIIFKGKNLLKLKEKDMQRIRGNEISMIFQEPRISLNPVFTIGSQIEEVIAIHRPKDRGKAKELAIQMLGRMGLPNPAEQLKNYPHQLSGGMCQRVLIAMALVSYPSLLIADEPTTALDVTIQAQILELLKDLKEEFSLSIILITHDLGVVAEICDQVAVMYAGKIIEYGSVTEIFENPMHPYTQGLIQSMPKLGSSSKRLSTIEGTVPNPQNLPEGCSFHPRCPYKFEVCLREIPEMKEVKPSHWVRCFNLNTQSF